MRLLTLVSLTIWCGMAAAGEVYKWVDKDGTVHYGDKPKHGAEVVNVNPSGETGEARTLEPVSEEQAKRAEACAAKQKLLAAYRDAPTITESDALGNTRDFTDAERKQLLARTERQVQEICGEVTTTRP